jgi:FMN phosphatase YigB (HAD superfamily)
MGAERLDASGLAPSACGLLCGPQDFGATKPAARPFREIAAALGKPPAEVTVIGDKDSTDGAGAAAAGMKFIKAATDDEWAKVAGGIVF